ncbi:TPA: restriction endonuclease subunit S [Escherichia coli]|uniref:restriction endonuclease subunit S n=1 Tax=Escherichia coli TaxID=562 RepID=UPI001B10ADD8|nr:restriction endonuclease subunit S [Escherichia coli]EHP6097391.1 restriction endonuclease subunit S [Escherichia coli]EHP7042432.1 restriction endonuclease subunit S [Escherichia coli]EIH9378414.1 restriction endonuclease subunit S [Escherichia coli]EIY0244328.1 restriction endonuclease subunit S [Escherichia coli]EJB4306559.1 restriction endonuclease subunit S [Escherichia coli]
MAREIILQKLPVGWSYNLLDNIAERCSGHTPSKSFPEYWNGGIKWISLADSCRLDKGYVYETDKEISLEGIKNSSAEVHPAETVVLSRDAGVGKSGVMATPMAVSQHFIAWKCDNKEKLHSWYLYNWLQLNKEEFERQAVGSTIKTIGLPYFKKLRIAVPPFDEQKKIAQILSTWDKAISVTEKLLTNSQQQKKALMQQLLTGKKRLLDENGVRFSGDWNSSKLGDLFNFKKGKGLSKSDLSESGINKCILYGELYTKYAEIAYEVISRTNSSDGQLSEPGDILLPASTTTSGIDLANATALSEGGILLGGDINILRPKVRLSSPFLAYFLTHMKKNEISSRAQGITIIHLYGGDLKSIDIVLPSTVQEQKKIATVLSAADAEISTLEKKLACLRDEKKALMQQLLTGKRRVKVDEAVTE